MESKIVKFNVGGQMFATTIDTVQRVPDSMLARMIDQPREIDLIKEGRELFIDRDGSNFCHILNYLRDGDEMALPKDADICQSLVRDADFYRLDGLRDLIENKSVFKSGDSVMPADMQMVAYLESIIRRDPKYSDPFLGSGCCYCWICHKKFNANWPTYLKKPKEHLNSSELICGKIHEIQGKCALVGFPWSMLRQVYGYDDVNDSNYCNYQSDCIVSIHVPLVYMKIKRV